jgi:hypothetical protein
VVHPVSFLDRCFPNYEPVPAEECCCRWCAESVCDSASFCDSRESAAGQLKSPVCEDMPQSYKATLRYTSTLNLPDEPSLEQMPTESAGTDQINGVRLLRMV